MLSRTGELDMRAADHLTQPTAWRPPRALDRLRRVVERGKWVSIAVLVASLLVMARTLPLERAIQALGGWFDALGIWGPLVYAGLYATATVLFVPGSVLTAAAGVFFGLFWGTVSVSIGSTTGAALAFLIGRYFAREAVARKVRQFPRFEAVDRAIAEGGWRVVALLRLSPAVPFNLQNYLYGLTAIRFWPTVLTSWIAMMPGTVMYVYLGYVSREGLAAAAGANGAENLGRWVLIVAGLIATVGVAVYVTRLAQRKLREREDFLAVGHRTEAGACEDRPRGSINRSGAPWGGTLLALLATLLAAGSACTVWKRDGLASLFGPPAVTLKEAYDSKPGGPTFDHATLDELLRKHVGTGGWVDYRGLRAEASVLDSYIAALEKAPFDQLGRDEKLALLINAYNAFTLRLILDHYPVESIKNVPADKRWDDRRWRVGGRAWSLNDIEHQQIRPKFREPRIHFALVCAAAGCPPLRAEAYSAARLEQQLEQQAAYVHSHDRWFRYSPGGNVVYLTKLYDWYGGDFQQVAGSVLAYAAKYAAPLDAALEARQSPRIEWLDYDWKLNSRENAP